MRTMFFGGGLLLAAGASVAVIGAQHAAPVHLAPHQICGPADPGSGDHTQATGHAAVLAEKLDLTSEQRATIDRVTREACAAMAKYHEQILGVLTAEQRATLQELHERDSGWHAWFRSLHGGR